MQLHELFVAKRHFCQEMLKRSTRPTFVVEFLWSFTFLLYFLLFFLNQSFSFICGASEVKIYSF